MKLLVSSVLLLSFVALTVQDIGGRRGCDCSVCKDVDNKLNPVVGKKIGDDGGGKSSCNICEKRKEMLRLEREKQEKLKKCPFDILGSPGAIQGVTSEEIFDEFREQIVPSQNGFFDGLLRGVVRTMHVSSVAELKWAKEKEARELARKKKEEEEARKRKEEEAHKRRETDFEPQKQEIVSLNNPVPPKVTVVLKQTPCGQILAPGEDAQPEKISMIKRLPKEDDRAFADLQSMDYMFDYQTERDYSDLNSKGNLLQPDLIKQLISYNTLSTVEPQNKETENRERPEGNYFSTLGEENNLLQSSTESPYIKFVSDEELKTLSTGRNSLDEIDMGLNALQNIKGVEMQGVDTENIQNINYSADPLSL